MTDAQRPAPSKILELAKDILLICKGEERIEVDLAREVVRLSALSETARTTDAERREQLELFQRDQTLERVAGMCEDQIAEDTKRGRLQSRSILLRLAEKIRALKTQSPPERKSE